MKDFVNVSKHSTDLLSLNLEDLMELLECDELNVKNECLVWETVVKWIDFDPEKRSDHVSILLRGGVRLGLVEQNYFREEIRKHHYVKRKEEECREIIIQTLIQLEDFVGCLIPNLCKSRLPHQMIFAVGGWSGGNPTETIETYDVRLDRWSYVFVDDCPGPRAYHGLVVIDSEIYLIGGFDGVNYFNGCWCFNVCVQNWKEIAPMHSQRCYVSVATLNGLIYAMGGYNGQHRQNTAEVYNRHSNQWNFIAPMNTQRSDADATAFKNRIYVVGGFNGGNCLNSVECYDPMTNQWTMLSSMRIHRSGVSAIQYQGCIYAVGGFNGTMRLRSVEKYDPNRNVWIPVPDMNSVRSNFGIEVLEDRIFVIGGFNGVTTIDEVEYYDSKSNRWQYGKPMKIVRSALQACVVSDLSNLFGFIDINNREVRKSRNRLRRPSSDSHAGTNYTNRMIN
ncbi:Kelch-like protein 10, variant 3 [Chamberlinius hualienensis]